MSDYRTDISWQRTSGNTHRVCITRGEAVVIDAENERSRLTTLCGGLGSLAWVGSLGCQNSLTSSLFGGSCLGF